MAFKPTNLLGLARALKQMGSVPSRAAGAFATWATAEMRRNYQAGVDPYGKQHAPLKPATVEKKGHDLTLRDSFAMMNSTRALPLGGAGVALRIDAPYAIFNVAGTKHMVDRSPLPTAGMPAEWLAELDRIVNKEFDR